MIYDVGILGRYNNVNCGGCLTVLATYATIKDMGFSAKLLKVKGHSNDKDDIYNRLCDFTKFDLNSPKPPLNWNKYFRNFLLCSDWTLYKKWFLPLDVKLFSWVDENINKISMAASFGTETGAYDKEDYPMLSSYLSRFNYLSVRENFSKELCDKIGIHNALLMPDPIFSQSEKYYSMIADIYPHERYTKYVAVYLLGMPMDKVELAIEIAKQLNFEPIFIIAVTDGNRIEKIEKKYRYIYENDVSKNISAWVYYLYHSEAVITNSFHGACLGYIFGKNVFGIYRGSLSGRLLDLMNRFGLENKMIQNNDDIEAAVKAPVDNEKIKQTIIEMNNKVRGFLRDSIEHGKRKMNRIERLPKPQCTGCMACFNICPKHCITAEKDKETGFLYPKIDDSNCINCSLCSKVCPVLSNKELSKQHNNVYCGFSKDKEVRYNSTSGGFFTELARAVFAKGNAVVFGAAYETPYLVSHAGIMEERDISKIRQSKYVQSEIRDTYLKMENYLREGRNVMFCGTPCQCAAVRSYMSLKKIPDDNLYLIDFICHSVNSPKAYAAYLAEIEKTNGDSIKTVWFKNKEDSWERFSTRIDFKNKQPYYIKNRYEDVFYKGFLRYHLYSRPSCSQCNFKGEDRHSDISLADAWGIKMNCDNTHGISTAIVHTPKGQKLFDAIREYTYVEEKTIQEM